MIKQLYLISIINLISLVSFAQDLIKVANKPGNKETALTIHSGERTNEAVIYKRITEKGHIQYYVQLYVEGGLSTPQTGATVLFKDGAVIEWTDAVVVSTFKNNQAMSQCMIKLTEEDIEYFQEKEIALIKLATHKRGLTISQAQRAKNMINKVICADLLDIEPDTVVSQ